MSEQTRHWASHYFRRLLAIVRDEGWIALSRRILEVASPAFSQAHLLVLSLESPTQSLDGDTRDRRAERVRRMTADLEIRQISDEEDTDLDALAAVDEWKASKASLVERLRDGGRCFIAKREGEIVAATWLTLRPGFREAHLKREFQLGANESYSWGSHCVPTRRGAGVMPRLIDHAMKELITTQGKSAFVMLVRPSNRLSIRPSEKIGFRKTGRVGFIETYGLRLHYIVGRNAFRHTRKRFSLQWNR